MSNVAHFAKLTLPGGVRIIRAPVRTRIVQLVRVAATGRAKQAGHGAVW